MRKEGLGRLTTFYRIIAAASLTRQGRLSLATATACALLQYTVDDGRG